MNKSNLIQKYDDELETLQFDAFTSQTALDIGTWLITLAKEKGYSISMDISRFNHQLFHFSFDGTTPDKDMWVRRKKNVVQHFYKSSIYMAEKIKVDGSNLHDKYGLHPKDYAAIGGSFPIIIKHVGVIGTITVSGLTPEEDHQLVILAIDRYLNT